MKKLALLVALALCGCAHDSDPKRETWTDFYENAVESPMEHQAIEHDKVQDDLNAQIAKLEVEKDPAKQKIIEDAILRDMKKEDAR